MSGEALYHDLTEMHLQMTAPVLYEVMIADARDGLSPSQMVERKLVSMLKATPLPMSCLQATSAIRVL